ARGRPGRPVGGPRGRAIVVSGAVARGRPHPGFPRRDHRAHRYQRMGVWLDWQEQRPHRAGRPAMERPALEGRHAAGSRQRQRYGVRRGQLTGQRLGVLRHRSKPRQSPRDRGSPAPAKRAMGAAEDFPGQLRDRLQRARRQDVWVFGGPVAGLGPGVGTWHLTQSGWASMDTGNLVLFRASVVSATDIWAAGAVVGGAPPMPMVATWNGSTWVEDRSVGAVLPKPT